MSSYKIRDKKTEKYKLVSIGTNSHSNTLGYINGSAMSYNSEDIENIKADEEKTLNESKKT